EAFRAIGTRHTLVGGDGGLVDTVFAEIEQACAGYGGSVRRVSGETDGPAGDLVLALLDAAPAGLDAVRVARADLDAAGDGPLGAEGYALARHGGVTVVLAEQPAGLLYGLFHVVRLGESAFGASQPVRAHRPALSRRMVNHWDNVDVHPV